MRYTGIGTASYAIAAVLVLVVVGVALARSNRSGATRVAGGADPAPSATEVGAPAGRTGEERAAPTQESASAAYQAECAGCHREGEARGRSIPALRGHVVELFTSEDGREYLIDLMLTGRVRMVDDGRVTYGETHPSYAELSDQRVAGILNHMLTSWGNDALLPADRRPYAEAEIAAHR